MPEGFRTHNIHRFVELQVHKERLIKKGISYHQDNAKAGQLSHVLRTEVLLEREQKLNLLSFNYPTSDTCAAVASGVSHLIVRVSMDNKRAAIGIKEGSRPR
jgi:hypothetical protein